MPYRPKLRLRGQTPSMWARMFRIALINLKVHQLEKENMVMVTG